MELLLIGIVIGLAIAFVVSTIKGQRKKQDARSVVRSTTADTAQQATYLDLRRRYEAATSKSDYVKVLQDINGKKTKLTEQDYTRLVELTQATINRLDKQEKARVLIEPKLVTFRALKTLTNREELFNELHRINTGSTGILTYEELSEFGTEEDLGWMGIAYETLLKEHFRELLVAARNGSVADYDKAMVLWEELEDFYSSKREDRRDFVREYLASEWNEMIIRFKREIDWFEDIYGYDEPDEDEMNEILRKALVDHDLLSMRLSLALAEEYSEFADVIIAKVTGEITVELETQLQAIGLKPGETMRTV